MKELTLINNLDLVTGRRFEHPRAAVSLKDQFKPVHLRTYAAAKSSRLTQGFGNIQTSADSEISSSLRTMRARARELVRDAPFAKRARTVVVNNVIGSGIGLQAQVKTTRDDLNKRVNTDIETVWEDWCQAKNCHTGGKLHFADIERFAMGQVFEAGEVFIRKHYRAFGDSSVPFALEMIEPERVLDEFQPAAVNPRAKVRMGVELDQFFRPVAYWIRSIHPGDLQRSSWETDRIERVPADQIIHLHIVDRWPQTRGVPWMHAAIRKLYDTDGYTEAEIVKARAQANQVGALKTKREYGEEVKDSSGRVISREVTSEAGTYEALYEDEELQYPPVTAPNSAADPFLRYMLRELAAATGVSYESLSRDYSQSNYSSSRLALLDDRDLWKVFQLWFIRGFRQEIHREFMAAAVLSRAITSISVESYAIDPAWYLKARYKPRGWSWVDPTKEVEAYKEAIKAGLTTRTDVIARTADGRDIEDMDEERKQELDAAKEQGLKFDTDPEFLGQKQAPKPSATEDTENTEKDKNNGQGTGMQAQKDKRTVAAGGRK